MRKKHKNGRLPTLVIIGAMKCGTTSLHQYLDLHPEIFMSNQKELNFFIPDRNWGKGIDWYRSNFSGNAGVVGESSPNYTNFPAFQGVAECMYSIIPDARLIYAVRDPVDRILSHYVHFISMGIEGRPLAQALETFPGNPYLCRSKYFMQLEQFLKYYEMDKIFILDAEDLKGFRYESLKKIFRFLNVDDSVVNNRFNVNWHQTKFKRKKTAIGLRLAQTPILGGIQKLPFEFRGIAEKIIFFPFSRKIKKPAMPPDLRERILNHLESDLEKFARFTGHDINRWFKNPKMSRYEDHDLY
jgi:hypothetical protein